MVRNALRLRVGLVALLLLGSRWGITGENDATVGPMLTDPHVARREERPASSIPPIPLTESESPAFGPKSPHRIAAPARGPHLPPIVAAYAPDKKAKTGSDSPPAALSPELQALKEKVQRCLDFYYVQPVSVRDHSPWGIMHAFIAFGVATDIHTGGADSPKVNAIGWLCFNGTCKGQRMLGVSGGKLQAKVGPGVQGHEGQFLALLAQSRVKTDFPIEVEGQKFTLADLIEHEKLTCVPGKELTFKLIGLVHYLPSDTTWKNAAGQKWDLPRLIKEELAQRVQGSACGGTHRMTGFSYTVNKRTQRDEPFTGEWLRARTFVEDYHKYTLGKLQNPDGSFSTNWFEGPGNQGGQDRRLETTGHILEWLVCSLPQEKLTDPQVVRAVDYLTELMTNHRYHQWEIGPRGHALHALALYEQRVFGAKVGARRDTDQDHKTAAAP